MPNTNYLNLIGVDEVGRGAWAGPVCVCAARLNEIVPGLKDSKQLSKSQRNKLVLQIRQIAEVGLGWASAAEIDRFGLTGALGLAMERALRLFDPGAPVLLDGTFNYLPARTNITLLAKADTLEPVVSAASIVAKVARDNLMERLALNHPAYGFEKHVGYGTAFHRSVLKQVGPCQLHRLSFTPIAQIAML
jgi:ribonuclease HII